MTIPPPMMPSSSGEPEYSPPSGNSWVAVHAKAVAAVLGSVIGSLIIATQSGSSITLNEWLVTAAAGIATFGAVFGVRNRIDGQRE